MADDARLHQILDLVEQARKEGDTVTEQKAIAAYKAASAPAPYVNKLDSPLKVLKAAGNQILRWGALADKGATDAIVDTAATPINAVLAIKNRLTGSQTPAVGGQFHLPVAEADNPVDRAVQLAGGFIAGSKIPIPGMTTTQVAQTPTQLTNAVARDAGYVLPPSSIQNAGGLAKTIEKLAGTRATNALATSRNNPQTAANIGSELGLPAGTPMSAEALDAVAANAWQQGYKPIEDLGPQYANLVDVIRKARENTKKFFTDNARTGRSEMLDKAREAQAMAQAAESTLEGALRQLGKPELLKNYQDARKTIAQTSAVDRALVDSTGAIKESAVAKEFGKGAPQSGALLAAGQTAQQAPKAFSTPDTSSLLTQANGWTGLGSAAGIAGGTLLHNPLYTNLGLGLLGGKTAVGLLKAGARKMLLSNSAQDAMQLLTPDQKNMLLASSILRGGGASNGSNTEDSQ